MASKVDSHITPEAVSAILQGKNYKASAAQVIDNLDRAHMIDENQTVTPLGAVFGQWWSRHVNSQKVTPCATTPQQDN
jgi:hypothetical protein